MKALYWNDFDCTVESRRIAHPQTIHEHHSNDIDAAKAFLRLREEWLERLRQGDPSYANGARYACVRGPKGLVRGVIE